MSQSCLCLNPHCGNTSIVSSLDEDNLKQQKCPQCNTLLALDGHYLAIEKKGKGSFGRTYLAKDMKCLGDYRIIKQFYPSTLLNQDDLTTAKRLFYQEAQQLKNLGKHPYIPQLYGFLDKNEYLYIIQEYIEGQTLYEGLKERLKQNKTYNEDEVKIILNNILSILSFVHQKEVIHRDIKPENIMINPQGELFLIDFGVSKYPETRPNQQPGTVVGTPMYAPYEQLSGEAYPCSDIYSLGVTAIVLLTGVLPQVNSYGHIKFDLYNTHKDIWLFQQYCQTHHISLSADLADILTKMIHRTPAKRHQTVQEVLDELNPIKTKVVSPGYDHRPGYTESNSNTPSLIQAVGGVLGTFLRQIKNQIPLPPLLSFNYTTVKVNDVGTIIDTKTKIGQQLILDIKGVSLELVYIQGGKFLMGSPLGENPNQEWDKKEKPQHWVTVKDFYMGKYPVTQEQYSAIMGKNPSNFQGKRKPVERVSWNMANQCVQELQKYLTKKYDRAMIISLPSEAQWEYACRAGTTTPFSYGNTLSTEIANYDGNYPYGQGVKGEYRRETTNVGTFPANDWGLYDLHGNVWEWCQDYWHENYEGAPANCTPWLYANESNKRVLRGGSWNDYGFYCRSAQRGWSYADVGGNSNGFRFSLSLP